MSDERAVVVVAAEPAVLGDAIVALLRRAGIADVRNASRDPSGAHSRHFSIAIVSPALVEDADADTVIVLPDAGSDTVVDLTADVIDLVAAEQHARSAPDAGGAA